MHLLSKLHYSHRSVMEIGLIPIYANPFELFKMHHDWHEECSNKHMKL